MSDPQGSNANTVSRDKVVANKPLLQRANELISGPRQADYGNKLQNFSQIANLWEATLGPKLMRGAHITPEDVALLMIQVKIARLAKMPDHQDSILDVAGYAGCYEAVQLEREAGWGTAGATVDYRRRMPEMLSTVREELKNWPNPASKDSR